MATGPIGVTLNQNTTTGSVIGGDTDGTYVYEIVKLGYSASGSTPTQVSSSNPLPVTVSGALPAGSNAIGAVTQSGTWTLSITGVPSGASLSDSIANPSTLLLGANLLGWDATNNVWRRVQVNPSTGAVETYVTNGLQPAQTRYSGAVTTTLILVKGAACTLYALDAYSPSANTGDVFLQIFDAATTGAVTLGSTAPTLSIGMAGAGGGADRSWAAGVAFANGIVIAATTTRAGSTAPSNALAVNIELT